MCSASRAFPLPTRPLGSAVWTRRALLAVQIESLQSEGYSFQVEMSHRAAQAGMQIAEVPITFTDRQYGRSKISRRVLLESFVLPWRLRLNPWQPARAVVQLPPVETEPLSVIPALDESRRPR